MKTNLLAIRVTQPQQTKCGTQHMFVWGNVETVTNVMGSYLTTARWGVGGTIDLDLKLDLGICSQPASTQF